MKSRKYCRANHVRGVSIKHNYLSSERTKKKHYPYHYSIVKQMKMEDFKQRHKKLFQVPVTYAGTLLSKPLTGS